MPAICVRDVSAFVHTGSGFNPKAKLGPLTE